MQREKSAKPRGGMASTAVQPWRCCRIGWGCQAVPSRLCTSSREVPRGAKNCASSSLLSTPRTEATLLPFPTLHAGVKIPWRLRRTCVSGWIVTRESLVSEVFAVVGAGSLLAPGQKCSCHVRHDSTALSLLMFNAQFTNNSRK